MNLIALATSIDDLPNDHDMPQLLAACEELSLPVEVCAWDNPAVDWSSYDLVVLRSTWNYTDRRTEFLDWCESISLVTNLFNPPVVARWATDKHYLFDLAKYGAPVVPSHIIEQRDDPVAELNFFFKNYPQGSEFVIKPTVGSYSKNVKRFKRELQREACAHIRHILNNGHSAIIQPYFDSVDDVGETNLVYFNRVYSHAIRKNALLLADGTVNGPTSDFRSVRQPSPDEHECALEVIDAAAAILNLDKPLLYARVDLIRDHQGKPQLLELDICEPSLSFPFAPDGAKRFAMALKDLCNPVLLTNSTI